ncbi:uncharacterized protein ACRADG_010255 [Cochliomyia hominivorax]
MLKYYFLYIGITVVLIPTSKCGIPIEKLKTNENFKEYSNLAAFMAINFISGKSNTLVIDENCFEYFDVKDNYQLILLNDLLIGLEDKFAIQMYLGKYEDRLWDYNIFIVDSIISYTFPMTEKEHMFNFFVLLTWQGTNKTELKEILHTIFEISFSYNVKNVVIMHRLSNDEYISFYSYDIFNKENCRNEITVQEINRYENGSLKYNFLFPDHMLNFHGCELNVSAHEVQPLLSFDGDVHNETHLIESDRLGGVEGDILKVVAETLNFKIRLHFPTESSEINPESLSTGCFGELDNSSAHIAIGGFSTIQNNSDKYSISFVYHSTPYVFVVRSGLSFGPIKQLLNPFSTKLWASLLIFFLLSFIFAKTVQMKPKLSDFILGPKNRKPIGSMLAIFFGVSIPSEIVPTRNFARFLLMGWLLLSFVLRNAYQGKMFDSLRFSKRIPVPQKISQLLEQDFLLLSETYIDSYPKNRTTIMRNTTKRLDMLQQSPLRVTATSLLDSLAYYNYINSENSSLTYVEETIHLFPCVMYFQKYSILRSSIDQKLKLLSDAGITSYIAKQHVRAKFQNMNTNSLFVSSLANENLAGLYVIVGIMFMISILVFILELLTYKSRKLRIIVNGLNSF